jgi:prevent-host-death family protein
VKKRKTFSYPPVAAEPMKIQEAAPALDEAELVVNVRAAKDQLSALLDQAAQGNSVVITSDGRPKAKLVPVHPPRRVFRVNWKLLRSIPQRKGPAAEELVRQERDGRD